MAKDDDEVKDAPEQAKDANPAAEGGGEAAEAAKAEKAAKKAAAKEAAKAKEAAAGGKPEKKAAGEKKPGGDKKGDKKGGKKAEEPAAKIKRDKPPRLLTKFKTEIAPALLKEFGYGNPMRVPRLVKIVINMGMGEAKENPKLIDGAVDQVRAIAGQAPLVTKAKKSIATFKLRQGMKIGVSVTLRRERMYEFLDRFVNLALPRVRDFKGVSPRSFDGRGNYSIGVREQIIFPEIDYDSIEKIKGLNITFVTTAKSDEEGRALLRHLGMPFRN
jgi:large subunit ribosomal protein L5